MVWKTIICRHLLTNVTTTSSSSSTPTSHDGRSTTSPSASPLSAYFYAHFDLDLPVAAYDSQIAHIWTNDNPTVSIIKMFKNHLEMIGRNETASKKAKFWQSFVGSLKGSQDIRADDSRRPLSIFRPISDYPEFSSTWPYGKSIYDDPIHAAERICVPGYRYDPLHRDTYGYSPRPIYPHNYGSLDRYRPVFHVSKLRPFDAEAAWKDHIDRVMKRDPSSIFYSTYPFSRYPLYLVYSKKPQAARPASDPHKDWLDSLDRLNLLDRLNHYWPRALSPTPIKPGEWGPRPSEVGYNYAGQPIFSLSGFRPSKSIYDDLLNPSPYLPMSAIARDPWWHYLPSLRPYRPYTSWRGSPSWLRDSYLSPVKRTYLWDKHPIRPFCKSRLAMAGPDVAAIAADLARAVELTMTPTASQNDRLKAYTACESFKETSPLCAEAGLFLAAGTQNSIIARHFGLQLMEHTVKYRWIQISQQEKIFIKENAMKLLAAGGIGDEPHMKDALSRVVVEMVKREWPQQWPGLLAELSDTCACGETQTELVLMVFLRLVEDVALLQTLESNQRRKDIYQALTTNMAIIFDFFLRLIELHVGQFRAASLESGNQAKAASHGRVVQVVLVTLTGFVEWVQMMHIMAHNGRLLQILCVLLTDAAFQGAAAECLSQIVNRKGKVEERKPLLILFNDEAIQCLATATKRAPLEHDEQHFLFKKKLIQILNGLCSQLCSVWGRDGIGRPPNFVAFLEAVIAFSAHPSLSFSHATNPIWNSMMKHELIAKDPVFLSYIPEWIQRTAPKIIKLNYPDMKSSSSMDSLAHCRLEFDSEEEYSIFFYQCRAEFLNNFRQATVIAPLVTFAYVEQWLVKCLQVANVTYGLSLNDPVYLEWEALASFLDSILSRVLQTQERPSVTSGLALLQLCLNYQPADPLILSTLLTCISALFVFLSMSSGQMAPASNSVAMSGAALLPQVLEKIFSALVFSPPGQNKDTRSRAVKNVRRHAASLMVKIGFKYPLLLLPVFDQIRLTVDNLSRHTGPEQLSTLERVTLQEALLLISNHFCDYERQSNFVGEVMHEANAQWIAIANSGAFKGAIEFMNFVGLSKPPVANDETGTNRSNLVFCVNLLLGAIKRCHWPEDPERATRGGFVVAHTESGNPICRNPAAPHVIPLLSHVLSLIRIFNELFSPEAQNIVNQYYSGCLNMLEMERANLLGLVGHTPEHSEMQGSQSPIERMQRFLTGLHESCYHLLGSIGPSLGRDLYSLPDLGPAIVTSVLEWLQYIPDFRLRPIIRVYLKSFIFSCPQPFYEVVVLPIIAHLSPIMVSRLHTKWKHVSELKVKEGQEENNADAQEVLEDILTRALTREYLDLLKVALVGGSLTPEHSSSPDTMETEDLSMDAPTPSSRNNLTNEVISDLGALMLRSEKTCESLVLTVLGALSWIDSLASLKATFLCGPIMRLLIADGSMNGEMAAHIMAAVLNGLNLHGQHETNQGSLLTLGAQMYELMRPTFHQVYNVMQQIPGINPVDLQKLDERISAQTSKGNKVEKVKKDLFKKITAPLIGRSVGELFKKEVKIHDLPRLQLPKKGEKKDVVPELANIFGA